MVEPENVEFDDRDVGDVNLVVVEWYSIYYNVVVRDALISFSSDEFLDVFV